MTLKTLVARVMRALPALAPGALGAYDIIDLLNEAQLNLARLSNKVSVEMTELITVTSTGVVDTDGTAVEYVSGDKFNLAWKGTIEIDSTDYTVSYVVDDENLVLTSSAGTNTAVAYEVEAIPDRVDFPTDLLKVVTVYYSADKNELETAIGKVHREIDSDEIDDSSDPTEYYTVGTEIILRPRPTTEDIVYVAYIPKPATLAADTDEPELDGADEYMVAYALYRIHLEANSPSFQLWDMERSRALATFMETSDQNYQTAFRVIPYW